jgi:ubiquinone/menaquinone biosynthesis C-methylase UbiE
MPIVGLDLSIYLLQTAKKRAKQANAKDLYLVRADMRYLPFRSGVFDNVINFWTSFGFFSEEENEAVLREIATVLKSGGTFVLHIANPGWLLRNFRERDWMEDERYISLEQRSVDWKTKRWRSKWIVVNKQTKEIDEISFDHRLYDLQELKELLNGEGLETAQVYGSFEKEDFDEARSNRIILLSRKR